jgi:hypothetical protein
MRTGSRAALLLLLTTGLGLKAQDPTYRFQGMLCMGMGDQKELTSSRVGYSFGMHGLYPVNPGEFLRPRVDVTLYPEITWATVQTSGSNLAFGCDFLQYLTGSASSMFLVGGLSEIIWSGTTAARPIKAGTGDTTRLGISVGYGYKVNDNVTYEARYTRSSLSKEVTTGTFGLGLTVKF